MATSCLARRSCANPTIARPGRDQQRDGEPALARRGALPEAFLRDAQGGPRRHQGRIFLATHEPCSLCLSAITWTGFDNFYYLFSHEDSRDSFAIPHDLKILKEVFTLDPGGYRPRTPSGRAIRSKSSSANCRKRNVRGSKPASARSPRPMTGFQPPIRPIRPRTIFPSTDQPDNRARRSCQTCDVCGLTNSPVMSLRSARKAVSMRMIQASTSGTVISSRNSRLSAHDDLLWTKMAGDDAVNLQEH